jgi:hypothetical protein
MRVPRKAGRQSKSPKLSNPSQAWLPPFTGIPTKFYVMGAHRASVSALLRYLCWYEGRGRAAANFLQMLSVSSATKPMPINKATSAIGSYSSQCQLRTRMTLHPKERNTRRCSFALMDSDSSSSLVALTELSSSSHLKCSNWDAPNGITFAMKKFVGWRISDRHQLSAPRTGLPARRF